MGAIARHVSHDHGITREVAEVYSRYGEVRGRLRNLGTDEDAISEDFYQAALNVYAANMLIPGAVEQLSAADRRDVLVSLATIALRWARKVRIDTASQVVILPREEGDTHHDSEHD